MNSNDNLTANQQLRIRQGIEVTVFGAIAILFYNYGPFWITAQAINLPVTLGFSFMMFACYLALRSRFVRAIGTSEEKFDGMTEKDDERDSSNRRPSEIDRRTYRVPRKFGIGAIIVLTMLIALITTGLRSLGAPTPVVMAMIAFVGIICMMQAILDRVPRIASCIAGVIFGCLFIPMSPVVMEFILFVSQLDGVGRTVQMLLGGGVGAAFGYLGGALAAGVVLVGDLLTEWWRGNTLQFSR